MYEIVLFYEAFLKKHILHYSLLFSLRIYVYKRIQVSGRVSHVDA